MSLLVELPPDLIRDVLMEWLSLRDFVSIDKALCNSDLRSTFFLSLQSLPTSFPVEYVNDESKHESNFAAIDYFAARNMTCRLKVVSLPWDENEPAQWNKFFNSVQAIELVHQYREGSSTPSTHTWLSSLFKLCRLPSLRNLWFNSLYSSPQEIKAYSLLNWIFENLQLTHLHMCGYGLVNQPSVTFSNLALKSATNLMYLEFDKIKWTIFMDLFTTCSFPSLVTLSLSIDSQDPPFPEFIAPFLSDLERICALPNSFHMPNLRTLRAGVQFVHAVLLLAPALNSLTSSSTSRYFRELWDKIREVFGLIVPQNFMDTLDISPFCPEDQFCTLIQYANIVPEFHGRLQLPQRGLSFPVANRLAEHLPSITSFQSIDCHPLEFMSFCNPYTLVPGNGIIGRG